MNTSKPTNVRHSQAASAPVAAPAAFEAGGLVNVAFEKDAVDAAFKADFVHVAN